MIDTEYIKRILSPLSIANGDYVCLQMEARIFSSGEFVATYKVYLAGNSGWSDEFSNPEAAIADRMLKCRARVEQKISAMRMEIEELERVLAPPVEKEKTVRVFGSFDNDEPAESPF